MGDIEGKKISLRILYPPDVFFDGEANNKIFGLYVEALECLSDEFDARIIGRIPEEAFRKTFKTSLPYVDFFKHPAFSKTLTKQEVDDAERYLGLPLGFIFMANQKRWHWLSRRGIDEKAAKFVHAWKDHLEGVDVVIPTLDNLYFIYGAERVAQRKGADVMKILRGRLVGESLMFWGPDNRPIYYKDRYSGEIGKRFRDRVLGQKAAVRPPPNVLNKGADLRKMLLDAPGKIMRQLARDERTSIDADIPALIPKYLRFISQFSRFLLYPRIHALFFDRPKNERFFLFPLHYEWEAQLAYRETFISQLGLAKLIADILPRDTLLYVKVHPHWKNADQSVRAVLDLKRRGNVRLIHPDVNTTELVKESLCVITINSTVGYEALLLNKPLVVLGHEAYAEAGIDVKDLNTLPSILAAIRSGEYQVDPEAYKAFLERYSGNIFPITDAKGLASEMRDAILFKRRGKGPAPAPRR